MSTVLGGQPFKVASHARGRHRLPPAAPPLGMLVAVAAAYILRGPGGGPHGIRAAQGNLPGTAPG
jgi:hypothetical protein